MQVLIFQWDLLRINKKYAISPDFCCKYGMTVIYQHLSSHPSSSPSLHHSCSVPQLLNRCHDSESGLRLGHAHTPVVTFSLTHTQTHTLCPSALWVVTLAPASAREWRHLSGRCFDPLIEQHGEERQRCSH